MEGPCLVQSPVCHWTRNADRLFLSVMGSLYTSCSLTQIEVKSRRDGLILEVRANGRDPEDILGKGRGLGLLSMKHYTSKAEPE